MIASMASIVLADLTFEATRSLGAITVVVLAGLVAVVLDYTVGLRSRHHGLAMRMGLLLLRLSAIGCLVLALLRPVWMSETGVTALPIIAVVVDDSASMSMPAQTGETFSAVSRYDKAVDILRRELLPAARGSHEVHLFDVQGRWMTADDLPTYAEGRNSALTQALLSTQRDLSDKRVAAIVLLSDGAERTDQQVSGTLAQLRVPVFPVNLVAATSAVRVGSPDLSVDAVTTNERAIVGNTVDVVVDMDLTGRSEASGTTVQILDGEQVVASRLVQWQPTDSSARSTLSFVPRRPGRFAYRVQAASIDGEVHLANNRRTFALDVRAQALTVLYVDGVLRWEGKFIRQALAADPDISVVSSVRTAPANRARGSQGLLLGEHLANIDVVILGDMEATFFSGPELEALAAWVTDSGGGLVVTGGYNSFGPKGLGRTALVRILPIRFSGEANPQSEQPFGLKLTSLGRSSPIFRISGDKVRDSAFYQSLPPLAGCSRIDGIKPGAQVLAVNPKLTGPGGGDGLPVMIVQQVGAGRAMVFTVDTTWKWSLAMKGFAGDASFYETLWGQLVRWMDGGEKKTPDYQLAATTDRTSYVAGDTIELKASASLAQGESGQGVKAQWRFEATAFDETGAAIDIALSRQAEQVYRGSVVAATPGRLDLFVRAERTDADAGDRRSRTPAVMTRIATVQVERPDMETLDARPDPQWLAKAAQLSGGHVLQPGRISSWVRQLPATPTQLTRVHAANLWRHPLLATAFFVLICLEWILRRRSRLA